MYDPREANNLVVDPHHQFRIESARERFNQCREDHPSNYKKFTYRGRSQFYSTNIDWEHFKVCRPDKYAKIKAEVDSLGVTWQQAEQDWNIRYQICEKAGYWY